MPPVRTSSTASSSRKGDPIKKNGTSTPIVATRDSTERSTRPKSPPGEGARDSTTRITKLKSPPGAAARDCTPSAQAKSPPAAAAGNDPRLRTSSDLDLLTKAYKDALEVVIRLPASSQNSIVSALPPSKLEKAASAAAQAVMIPFLRVQAIEMAAEAGRVRIKSRKKRTGVPIGVDQDLIKALRIDQAIRRAIASVSGLVAVLRHEVIDSNQEEMLVAVESNLRRTRTIWFT